MYIYICIYIICIYIYIYIYVYVYMYMYICFDVPKVSQIFRPRPADVSPRDGSNKWLGS